MDEITIKPGGQVLIFRSRGFSKQAQDKMAGLIKAYMKDNPGTRIETAMVDQNKDGVELTLFINGKENNDK